MSPVVIRKVQLGDDRVTHIRVQTATEYCDMQAALKANSESDLSDAEKVKRGLAIKISSTVCEEDGKRKWSLPANPDAVMNDFIWTDANILAKAINDSNGLGNKEVEEAEKN